ncbi:MAG: YbjN domain-containing protein [Bacteroidetes bacterium]|nr:YbjN domain-containing protein [Bacteroidota bacterium]
MTDNYFAKVRDYILELGYQINHIDENDGVIVISDEDSGISNLVIGIADPLLIVEQFIFNVQSDSASMYKALLQKNRDIIHGAFVLDDSGTKVLFRDTLQLENLDLNELEATVNSLALLLSEYSDELIQYSHQS